MAEETLLSSGETRTRAEIATQLRSLADGFDGDGSLTLAEGDQQVSLTLPDSLEFELEVEREYDEDDGEAEEGESSELSIEVEIEWDEVDADGGSADMRSERDEESEGSDTSEDEREDGADAVGVDAEAASTGPVPIDPDQKDVPEAAIGEIETAESLGQFQLYVDHSGKWRWRLVHRNGNIIAASGQGYSSKQKARQGMHSVMRNAPDAAAITTE